jgi:hypothetical protein
MLPPDFLKEENRNNGLVGGIGSAAVGKPGKEGENEQNENGREERKRNEGSTWEGSHKGVAEREWLDRNKNLNISFRLQCFHIKEKHFV